MTERIGRLLDATREWSATPEGQREIEEHRNSLRGQTEVIASEREIRPEFIRMPLTLV